MSEWARDEPDLDGGVVIALVVEDVPDEQNVLNRDHSASRERVC
jgi:hypothetical protein